MTYNLEQKKALLYVAHQSIKHGFKHGAPLTVRLEDFPKELQQKRATFVTLKIGARLRGCIGTWVPALPLIKDVVEHAFAAAFRDPRFAPLAENESDMVNLSIAILSLPEPVNFSAQQDLIKKIRPHVDGLILETGLYRATLLPSVWESLHNAQEFLDHLKLKAGLAKDFWSDQIKISRYTTEIISET